MAGDTVPSDEPWVIMTGTATLASLQLGLFMPPMPPGPHPATGANARNTLERPQASDSVIIEGGTRVTVRQEDFGHSAPAYEHAAGWEHYLEWLADYLKQAK
jgi:hypothetical protein